MHIVIGEWWPLSFAWLLQDSTSLSPTNLGCSFSIMKLYNCTYSQDYPHVKLIMEIQDTWPDWKWHWYSIWEQMRSLMSSLLLICTLTRWQSVDLNILIIVFSWNFSRAFLGLEIRFNHMKGLIHDLPWGHRTLRIFFIYLF